MLVIGSELQTPMPFVAERIVDLLHAQDPDMPRARSRSDPKQKASPKACPPRMYSSLTCSGATAVDKVKRPQNSQRSGPVTSLQEAQSFHVALK